MHYHVTTARRCVDGYLAIKTTVHTTREDALSFYEATLKYPETVGSIVRGPRHDVIASHPPQMMIRR